MGVVGAALRGFGKALKKKSKSKWVKDKAGTITGVKPYSGKVPWYVGATPNTPASRARIVKTHFNLKRSDKITAAEKKIREGKKAKETLKDLEATGQATELKGYKGKGTGIYQSKRIK